MIFRRLENNRYCQISDCEQYTVAAVDVGERWAFMAWNRAVMLGCFDTADQAREACKAHAGRTNDGELFAKTA